MTATISCIIPAYNCQPYLERAVASIFETGYPSLEVIIVDDGSTDETIQVARRLEANAAGGVRVVQHIDRGNHGVSASRNLGIAETTGDYVCFLDADDYVYAHRFESAVEILSGNPDIDGVHQLAEIVFPEDEDVSQRWWWGDSTYFGFEQSIDPSDLLKHLLRGKCWATSAILVRRSLLERTGLFHERLTIAEDCHLWFRMASVGKLVSGDLSQPVSAYWRRAESAYQPSPMQRVQMIRSMTTFLRWLRSTDVEPRLRSVAYSAIHTYILTGLIEARFAKKRKLAWSIAWQGVRGLPSITLDPSFFGQVARLAARR